MRNLFAVPRLTLRCRTLLSFAVAMILVFGVFALLKISSRGKQTPADELITGSIQRSSAVGRPESNDPMASFLAPALSQASTRLVQSNAVDRGAVPLPRPRPKLQ
jgi:hypothetical protein